MADATENPAASATSEPKRSWGDVAEEEEEKEKEERKQQQQQQQTANTSEDKSTAELDVEGLTIDESKKVNKFLDEAEDSSIKTVTTGDTPYTSATTFEDLNLSPELLKGLYVEMKFQKPSKIQAISLPMILTPPYRNLIAQARNGSGKTTCFVLGMLSRVDPNLKAPQALCICPTRELAIQNLEVLRKMGKHTGITSECAVPTDSTNYVPISKRPPVTAQVVIGTPGTIKKWMSAKKLGFSCLKILVYDEADHMLDEAGFRDDSLRIMKDIERSSGHCQVLLFSATFNETVKNFVTRIVKDYNQLFVKKEELSLESVKQYKVYCPDELAKVMVIRDRIFELGEKMGQTIIFVRTKNSASALHKALKDFGYEVTTIMGATAIREQIFGSNVISPNSVPMMNGFVQQAMSMDPDMARTVMSGFKPEVIPIYTELANEFAVFDRWFASVPSSTQPNRFYVHSATSHGCQSNVKKDLIHGFPQKTIFDSVDENGLTFGIYYQNIPATLFFKSLRKLKHLTKFHSYGLKFKRHARLGKLPNYAVIEQRYFDVSLFPANDDHPSHDVAEGQRFVKEVYETLRSSPQWNEMAFLITYDEHGGFFDHVPTPVSHVPSPDGVIGPDPFFFRFDRLGVRVPTLLISPWIDKGTVIHGPNGPTPHSEFEHSSIPATVKKLFNLKSNFLTKRDAWAGTFEKFLQLRKTPRDDCPVTLPEVTRSLRPWGPREDKELSEFQVELIQLAAQLVGDYVLNTYPDMGKNMTAGEANRYAEDAVKRFLEAGKAAIRAGANESAIVTMRPSLTSRTAGGDYGSYAKAY